MGKGPTLNRRRLVLLVWILVAILYFYLSYDYISVSMADRQLGEYLRYVTRISGSENRPGKEIRTLILVRAEQLGLPVHDEHITIIGSGTKLSIAVDYQVDIDIPVFADGLYAKHFSHKVRYDEP